MRFSRALYVKPLFRLCQAGAQLCRERLQRHTDLLHGVPVAKRAKLFRRSYLKCIVVFLKFDSESIKETFLP